MSRAAQAFQSELPRGHRFLQYGLQSMRQLRQSEHVVTEHASYRAPMFSRPFRHLSQPTPPSQPPTRRVEQMEIISIANSCYRAEEALLPKCTRLHIAGNWDPPQVRTVEAERH